ncbi:phage minor head protein [Streptomyces zaomyceticus]|uniref:phage minor head protein n=1 Tax=Streptomyces zaomyceticus TaxID=68286 RepID=UPI00364F1EFF
MDEALQRALDAAEEDPAREVADVLAEVAAEYATALEAATELVAARFSVSRIAAMWTARVPRLACRLLGIAETAATRAAEDVDAPLPDGWDDLPGRYEDGTLPSQLGDYVTTTEHLLRAVGDRLAAVAVEELAAGVTEGQDVEQLRARLRAAFAREGAQLGEVREERIARTESGRAWNMATRAAAQALTGPDRPLVKQWLTRRDPRVRDAHDDVNGQLRLLDEPFTVAGVSMTAPSDPTAPPELVRRTIAGIVTVGMNSRGMWFSGAAAPWLAEWDRTVFTGCQPSYHMSQGSAGKWQLRAVLSVPVPGHSSPLLASVAERANLALAASAANVADSRPDTVPAHLTTVSAPLPAPPVSAPSDQHGHRPDTVSGQGGDTVEAMAALLTSPEFLDHFAAALADREAVRAEEAQAELERLTATVAPAREEIAAGVTGTNLKGRS